MGKYVHPEWPLGVQPHVGTQIKDYHLGVKKDHPRYVSLVRVRKRLLPSVAAVLPLRLQQIRCSLTCHLTYVHG